MLEVLNISSMGIAWGSVLMLGLLFLLLSMRIPLAFVTGLVALFFVFFWVGPVYLPMLVRRLYGFVNAYVLVSVPMFVLMAAILDRSGIAKDLFNTMKLVAGRLPGGVAIQTLIVAVFLAAMSGIIGGETVLLGLLALPQMLRLGYDKKLAIGTVCAGGALGTMIPPSIVLIIYGLYANVSIGHLFTASLLPGLILASLYIGYILVRCTLNPALAPVQLEVGEKTNHKGARQVFFGVVLPICVAMGVLASIYLGVASVTEASALGAAGMALCTWLRGELSWQLLRDSAMQTLRTCGMIIWIGIGASLIVGVYTAMHGMAFVESLLLNFAGGSPLAILLLMMLILFVLGMFLDWIGIAMLTMPVFVPIVAKLGYDPIWFGVLFCMNMQLSFLTPPFGPAAFYLKSVAPPQVSLPDIYRSVLPFIVLQFFALALLIAFPELALWWIKA